MQATVQLILTIIVYIALGFVGALLRLLLQWYRDGEITQTQVRIIAILVMGCIAGFVAYELGESHLATMALGFVFPDIAENLLSHYWPKQPAG